MRKNGTNRLKLRRSRDNAANPENERYVSYNGFVQMQAKSRGNPRHGYRCVRPPQFDRRRLPEGKSVRNSKPKAIPYCKIHSCRHSGRPKQLSEFT